MGYARDGKEELEAEAKGRLVLFFVWTTVFIMAGASHIWTEIDATCHLAVQALHSCVDCNWHHNQIQGVVAGST